MEMLTLLKNRKGKKLLPVLSNQNSDIAIKLTNNSKLRDIKFRIGEYERIGMKEKVKELRKEYSERATAIILKKYNLRLLKIEQRASRNYNIEIIGKREFIHNLTIEKLVKSRDDIPINILKKIPDNFAKRKVYIAKQSYENDPYIIAHLKGNYYVAFYWWE